MANQYSDFYQSFHDAFILKQLSMKKTYKEVSKIFNETFNMNSTAEAIKKRYYLLQKRNKATLNHFEQLNNEDHLKILIFDIETAPMLGYVWGLYDNNVALNQLEQEWFVMSYSAKWLGDNEDKIFYYDQRNEPNMENDINLLKEIWNLLDQADIVITQNGKKFDVKKLNARFIINGFQPPSSYRHIDTYQIAKKHFAFTSNKLEYMTDKLCTKYKKLKHGNFPGFAMWRECLKGNIEAWKEMEEYNKYDVLSLEELYIRLIPWDNSINFNIYKLDGSRKCSCGNNNFIDKGFHYTNTAKYKRFKCYDCGAEIRDNTNLIEKDKINFKLIK